MQHLEAVRGRRAIVRLEAPRRDVIKKLQHIGYEKCSRHLQPLMRGHEAIRKAEAAVLKKAAGKKVVAKRAVKKAATTNPPTKKNVVKRVSTRKVGAK